MSRQVSAGVAPVAELARLLAGHGRAVVLTGAGMSTESGVPDFRSTGSGTLGGFPAPPAMVRGEQSWPAPHATESGTLGGFPAPPAVVRGEQSSPAPHATGSGTLGGFP